MIGLWCLVCNGGMAMRWLQVQVSERKCDFRGDYCSPPKWVQSR
jgi:hypothetical protein